MDSTETRDTYAFPLYHHIGQVARRILAARCWIAIVLIAALALLAVETSFDRRIAAAYAQGRIPVDAAWTMFGELLAANREMLPGWDLP